jgi:phosphoglycerate dehydrogenase-like enzyme
MSEQPPRLLLVVPERAGLREAVAARLPGVPFALSSDPRTPDRTAVEAMLLGAFPWTEPRADPSGCPRLRFVQRLFAGVDDLPFERFPPAVEIAGNVGGYSPFVAQHAIALALACARCVLEGNAAVAQGRSRPPPELRSFWHETVLILGYGAIGRSLSEGLHGLGARVHGLGRTGAPAPGAERMYSADELLEAVRKAALVIDVRPLTARTARSLGRAAFEAMREDAIFVNVGRAGTVDDEALFQHLQGHPRFRAGLDVWWQEDFAHGRLSSRFPFTSLPNFVGSPHWAGYAPAVPAYALGTALDNLARFFAGERPQHLVDRGEYAGLREATEVLADPLQGERADH